MWSKNSQTVGFLIWDGAGRSHDNKEREFEGQTGGRNCTTLERDISPQNNGRNLRLIVTGPSFTYGLKSYNGTANRVRSLFSVIIFAVVVS